MANDGTANQPPEKKQPLYRYIVPQDFRDLVDGLTLVVVFVTMIFVIKYAEEAHTQNISLTRSIQQQEMVSRPVIIANGVGVVDRDQKGVPIKVRAATVNFGQSTAPKMTAVGHLFIANAGDPAPVDPQCVENGPWPKGNRLTALVPFQQAPSLSLSLPASPKKGADGPEAIVIQTQPIGATPARPTRRASPA